MTLQETALQVVQTMIDMGYTPFSAWNDYETVFAPIIRNHRKYEKTEMDIEAIAEYIQAAETRYKNGKIT